MDLILGSVLPSSAIAAVSHPKLLLFQNRRKPRQANFPNISACSKSCVLQVNQRRSANYHPTIWDHRFLESLKSPYTYECFTTRLEELKERGKWVLKSTEDPLVRLQIIDSIQRLGVAYHFEEEIKETLDLAFTEGFSDLYTTSLRFRLLRQHDYPVSSDVFNKFKNSDGKFMECLSQDVEGLLSFYEASHLLTHGEDVLEETKEFTSEHLKSLMEHLDIVLAKEVQQSLEIPLHWRMLRLEARNFMDVYERDDKKSLVLLELAKLDFNLVQSVHQRELRELSRWWKELGFRETLSFSRDRLLENFVWASGIIFGPNFSKCRDGLTKFTCIVTAIDDIYDVYGSLDELELFTEAVCRWDTKAAENLPNYMKIGYLAMFNFANKIAYDIHQDQGFSILPYIKKEWENLCKSYLVEARWFFKGYRPTMEEYLGNAWISVAGPAAMVHAYFLLEETITNESIESLNHGSELIYWSSLITRLCDDLGTSKAEMDRGDVPKSIQCYMNEKGVSEEQAREHVKGLVSSSWKKLNEERVRSPLPKSVVNMTFSMARTAQFIFQHGDGIGTADGVTKDRVTSLFIEPIPMD